MVERPIILIREEEFYVLLVYNSHKDAPIYRHHVSRVNCSGEGLEKAREIGIKMSKSRGVSLEENLEISLN